MFRITVLIALLISLVALSRFGSRMLESRPTLVIAPIQQQGEVQPSEEEAETGDEASYYPEAPEPLPDLDTGYLFTESRSLVKEYEGADKNGPGRTGEPEVDLYSVVYVGSIISGDIRKAIISAPPEKEVQAPAPGRPGKLSGRRQPAAQSKPQEFVRISQGEIFRGYKVKLVSPDKLVFERGDEIVERLLYDPAKKRAAGPLAARGPARPPQVMTPPPVPGRPVVPESPDDADQIVIGGPDNVVADPQQPATIIRRPQPRPPNPDGESQPQGILLERPPR